MERALPLAMFVRQTQLHPVLPRPRAAAEDLVHREEIEIALGLLRRQLREPLRRRLRAAQRRRDESKEQEDCFQVTSCIRSVLTPNEALTGARPVEQGVREHYCREATTTPRNPAFSMEDFTSPAAFASSMKLRT